MRCTPCLQNVIGRFCFLESIQLGVAQRVGHSTLVVYHVIELSQDLIRQRSCVEFPELLIGKTLKTLYYLNQPRAVSETADWSDNYHNTVNRVLKWFRNRGRRDDRRPV
jgi:hypothetical protein